MAEIGEIFVFRLLAVLLLAAEGVLPLQQFLQTPRDTAVAEGHAAVLPCQVGSQVGQVQWTKDGLTLGYDRELPGFDRYSVLGRDSEGTYNLEVANATISDEAKYECQVGPGRGNPPIRANARLTVTLPPTRIEMLNHPSGARLEVKEHEEVELACRVSNAKPTAAIIWYRNNVAFNPGAGNIEDSEEDGSLHGRKTTLGRIRFRPSSDDNQATFACEADHPALRGSGAQAARSLRTAVLLSVLYPPEKPEITGYIQGETIRMGATVKIVCQAYGGNPLAQVVWFKNNQRIDNSYTTTGARSENTLMFLAQPDDNNAAYRCEAKNRMVAEPLTAEIVMSVQFAPDSVDIRGPQAAKVGDRLTFNCQTSNSNPASSLQWVVDGRSVPGLHNRTDTSAEGGWVSLSNISVTVGEQDKIKTVSCYANNLALSETKVETHLVTVLYPPDAPSITGYRSGQLLKEGELRRVKCTALSGNPLPSLSWWRGGALQEEGVTRAEGAGGTFVSAELSLTAGREDNGAVLECRATNQAAPAAVVTRLELAVTFPPRNTVITVTPPKPEVGQEATLTCTSDSSNPDTDLQWWLGDEQVAGGVGGLERRGGEFGGSVTEAALRIRVTENHIAAVFKCEAKQKGDEKGVYNITKIDVQYKPRFLSSPREVSLEAGSSKTVRLPTRANPPVSDFSWVHKSGGPVAEVAEAGAWRVAGQGDTLHLRGVTEQDTGTYILRAESALGKARRSVALRVLHPPRFVTVTKTKLISEGDSVTLQCLVEADPLPPGTVRWAREGYTFASRTRVSSLPTGSSLTISNATLADAGVFHCLASNGVPRDQPREVRETLYLLVHQRPTIDSSPSLRRSASAPGSQASLLCRAQAAPNVTFSWSRGGRQLGQGTGHTVVQQQVDPLTWESRLQVARLASQDFGSYICHAENQWGSMQQEVVLGLRSRPDAPSQVVVTGSTYNSVSLQWTQGFSGGFPQYFRVRLQRLESHSYLFVDVFPHNATEFTVGELQMDTSYSFALMAFNKLGESSYSGEVRGATASQPPPGARQRLIDSVLEERGHIPLVIIVTVSVAGVLLLCLNAVLLYCFMQHRRAQDCTASLSSGSSGTSTKSATIEMYVGSSYNETLSGETLSSLSEKSDTFSPGDLAPRPHLGPHPALCQEYSSGPHEYSSRPQEYSSGPQEYSPGPGPHYLVDHNPIYGAQGLTHTYDRDGQGRPDQYDPSLPSRPVSRSLSSVYGQCTLPRTPRGPPPPHQGGGSLARQRSVSNLDCEGKDQDSLVWL